MSEKQASLPPLTASEDAFITEPASRPSTAFEPSYRMGPARKFRTLNIERATENLLERSLADERYDPQQCRRLSRDLAATIMEELKTMMYPRYKFVVVVNIGSKKEKPGVQLGSRCLWNDSTDSMTTVHYNNGSLFAVVMVYGLYQE